MKMILTINYHLCFDSNSDSDCFDCVDFVEVGLVEWHGPGRQ